MHEPGLPLAVSITRQAYLQKTLDVRHSLVKMAILELECDQFFKEAFDELLTVQDMLKLIYVQTKGAKRPDTPVAEMIRYFTDISLKTKGR